MVAQLRRLSKCRRWDECSLDFVKTMKVNPYEPVVIQSGPRAAADNGNANSSITHAHVCKVCRIFGVFGLLCPGTWMALLTLIASLSVALRSLKDIDFAYFFYGVRLFATSIAQLLFVICLMAGFFCKRTRAMSICATAMLGTHALLHVRRVSLFQNVTNNTSRLRQCVAG
jgi:hypothetical protein